MSAIHCKHYDGREILAGKGKCRVGIDPRVSFCDGNQFGMIKRIPCLKSNKEAPPCHLQIFPTKEEAEAEEAAFEAQIDDFLKHAPAARKAMVATGKEGGKIDCPKCGGALHWSRARSNGHIHARCETEDCLSWME